MFQCILTGWVHCLHKAISLTGKELINFQGVWDGFNCYFSKSGKTNCFHIFCQTQIILSSAVRPGDVGRMMTSLVGREMLGFAHHSGPWDKGRSNKQKLVLAQKVLLRRIPSEFLQLPFFQNKCFPRSLQTLTLTCLTFPLSLIPTPFSKFLQFSSRNIEVKFSLQHVGNIWPCYQGDPHPCSPLEDRVCVLC